MTSNQNQSFKVFIRCRPLNQKQTSCFSNRKAVFVNQPSSIVLLDIDNRETNYNYDGVFSEHISTESIFQKSVQPVINHFINGYNSTVFAYGITGAGKSYTMFGSDEHYGLIPLTINSILDNLGEGKWNLKMSYIEIYNQQIFDLFVQKSDNLQVIEDPDRGVIVMDVQQREIKSYQNAHQYITEGNIRRVMAQTYANDFSSRSHAIILLTLEREVGDKIVTAKMSLVDLAGSQKATVYTGNNKGTNRLQGSNINKSLLALGNCIMILSQNSKKGAFVPYRDSKLTRLLKDSLGGNTKTVMIACISQSPICYDQTLSTLKYAGRARRIEKTVVQNSKQQLGNYQQLKFQNERLKKQNQILKLQKTKQSKDKKSKSVRIQNLLNNLIETVRQRTKEQIEDKLSLDQSRMSQNYQNYIFERQSLIQQIVKTATGQIDFSDPANLFQSKIKVKVPIPRQTKDKRSKTIYKHGFSNRQPESKTNVQLNSLNNARNHRRRNSIMHSQSMSNTLNFLNNFSNLQQSKVNENSKLMLTKSMSTLSIQQGTGRKSKHLNVLKQIQQMSKKLKVISKNKKVYHNSSIQQGVDEQNQYQYYQTQQVL